MLSIQPPWKPAMGTLLLLSLAVLFYGCEAHASSWFHKDKPALGITLKDIVDIQNDSEKPCVPEMELALDQKMHETGWWTCEKVRIRIQKLTVVK